MRQKAHTSRYIDIDLGKEIITIKYKERYLIILAFLYSNFSSHPKGIKRDDSFITAANQKLWPMTMSSSIIIRFYNRLK